MPKVTMNENNNNVEDLIRAFKRSVNRSGILNDLKRHEAFLPKSLRRKIKSEEARRRRI